MAGDAGPDPALRDEAEPFLRVAVGHPDAGDFPPTRGPRLLDPHPEVGGELVAGAAAAVDLHHEVGRRIPQPHVEVLLDGPNRAHRRRVQVEARVGLERAVVAEEPQRARALPGDMMSRGGQLVCDADEQVTRLRRRTFMGEPRLGHELPHLEALVVAAAGRVVVLRQPVEERARHGNFHPNGRVGRRIRHVGGGLHGRLRSGGSGLGSGRGSHGSSIQGGGRTRADPGRILD